MARTIVRYGTLGKKLPRRGRRRVKYQATPCDQNRNAPYDVDRASAERLGLAAHPRVGLTTFLPISNEPAALTRGLIAHVTERKAQ
jgi:hypothetical protein